MVNPKVPRYRNAAKIWEAATGILKKKKKNGNVRRYLFVCNFQCNNLLYCYISYLEQLSHQVSQATLVNITYIWLNLSFFLK